MREGLPPAFLPYLCRADGAGVGGAQVGDACGGTLGAGMPRRLMASSCAQLIVPYRHPRLERRRGRAAPLPPPVSSSPNSPWAMVNAPNFGHNRAEN
jgi:hypothetical protein